MWTKHVGKEEKRRGGGEKKELVVFSFYEEVNDTKGRIHKVQYAQEAESQKTWHSTL